MSDPAAETAFERSGSGPPVVLIHGLGLRRAMWQWQLPALGPHFEVLSYDLLGHGDSADPADKPRLVTFTGQLLRLMDRCRIERAALVGFSLGGMIARRMVLDHPDRVSALAVLAPPHARTEEQREAVRTRVRQARVDGPAATVEAALVRWFTPAFHSANPDLMALVRGWVQANDPAVYPGMYRIVPEDDEELETGLDAIACPTLVMTGSDDTGNTPAMSQGMAAAIPGARCVIVPGMRHMGLAESPDVFNRPLLAFLREALARPGSKTR